MERIAYRARTLSAILRRAASQFPAVIVTGPRQSGKTTLVRRLFGETHRYVTLDDPLLREQATGDPRLLLSRFPPPLILDEIQYAPDLLNYVKIDIDQHRAERGRYVVTGSQSFPLMQGVTETLAGRAAILSLLSMSLRELSGEADADGAWADRLFNAGSAAAAPSLDPAEALRAIYVGGFPEPALTTGMDVRLWQSSYVQTYLERDVRSLRAVADLGDYRRFLLLLAQRTGGTINYSDLARDLGVAGKTAKAWVSILETSGQVLSLRPYFANVGKRLVRQPKVYYLDTGVLSYLLDLTEPAQVAQGMHSGPLFEAAVLGQLVRLFTHRGEQPRLYFWRTAAGHEVDFVIEHAGRLAPIEAKLTATPTPKHAAAIERFQDLFGAKAGKGLVVCLCAERLPLTRNVEAVPFGSF